MLVLGILVWNWLLGVKSVTEIFLTSILTHAWNALNSKGVAFSTAAASHATLKILVTWEVLHLYMKDLGVQYISEKTTEGNWAVASVSQMALIDLSNLERDSVNILEESVPRCIYYTAVYAEM